MADRDEYCIKCGYKHDQHLTSDWCCPSDSEQDHKRKNAEITTLKAEVERLRDALDRCHDLTYRPMALTKHLSDSLAEGGAK